MASPKRKIVTNRPLTAVVATSSGEIFELEGYAALGMAGDTLTSLSVGDTVEMPFGSELMLLPDRIPAIFNLATQRVELITHNPYNPMERIFPVAVFNSPGYVNTYACAYNENENAGFLPLFAYGAVGWDAGVFRSAAIRVDRERRQDLRLMDPGKVKAGVGVLRKKMPANRLREHLETCALIYGCPAAKNFFLSRCEAPLPTSTACNARCLGCISLQEGSHITSPQQRIAFTPTPEEIADVALSHMEKVDQAVVSFGQGCEGDPLLAARAIEPAIRMIRQKTDAGTINMNTNGSRPDILSKMFEAGLDSIRISINSFRAQWYNAYFRPIGYRFADVVQSIAIAVENNRYVSINYLNCPGVTDTPEEMDAFTAFLDRHPVNLIQWRNLNFDPARYWKAMTAAAPGGKPVGMRRLLHRIRRRFPGLRYGYFNPPKERF